MKRIASLLVAVALYLGPVLALALCVGTGFVACGGCKSPESAAYNASKTAHITALAAMAAWSDYVTAKHPPVEQERKVEAAFNNYKAAQLVLLDATKAYMQAGASPDKTVQDRFDLALASGGAALADLINLIQSLGVKL